VNGERPAAPGLAERPTGAFALPLRVYYQHTDAGGVVYHARYLDFMEAARTELLHDLGFDLAELATREHVLFIVYRMEVDYRRPALLDDRIEATAEIRRAGRARLEFAQTVRRGAEVLVEAVVHVACMDARSHRPVPLPERLRTTIAPPAPRNPDPPR
jgi:acyl-CoA thioester hydrolase